MNTRPTLSLPPDAVPLSTVAVRLHPEDDVAIAKIDLREGIILLADDPVDASPTTDVTVRQTVPGGHKVALRAIDTGGPVRRYGQVIGFATRAISPGEHVHTHNLSAPLFDRAYDIGADVQPVELAPEGERRTFMGYARPSGRAGTRNMVAVLSSVNCSAHVTRQIARYWTPQRLAPYPNVDGVIAITHHAGCSVRLGGEEHRLLQRTLAGFARHPNVGAHLFVGLGCEVNQIDELACAQGLEDVDSLIIQDEGGVRKTIEAGIAAVKRMLPAVNAVERTPQPLSHWMVALQCGGSDSWSGVTSNPLLGLLADEVVRQGGTVVLGETPEIYGAEQLLLRRAVSAEVGQKLIDRVRWWEAYADKHGVEIDNNPTPGNKAGGLTTIYEKSLGAIAKGGSTPLTGVYQYAEPVTARGFTFMDTPGNDWVGVTGQVAGGCTLVVFSTGRGSAFGFKPAPSIRVASNSTLYRRMVDDMDVNAGRVLEGEAIEDVAGDLLDLAVAVASGQPSKSEALGIGEDEFCPWPLGGLL
jgi:altronate hydrolase